MKIYHCPYIITTNFSDQKYFPGNPSIGNIYLGMIDYCDIRVQVNIPSHLNLESIRQDYGHSLEIRYNFSTITQIEDKREDAVCIEPEHSHADCSDIATVYHFGWTQ